MDDKVLEYIDFAGVNDTTNFYKMRVKDYEIDKDKFSGLFEPFVEAIQTHGNPQYAPKPNFNSYLVKCNDGETYVTSNLMRDQMDGILHYFRSLGFKEEDFSETGAARTVTCDLSSYGHPDVTMDYVPQFIIPFQYLPKRLQDWYYRDSVLLTPAIKSKIKDRGGIIVAKSPKQSNEESKLIWRIAVSPGDLIIEAEYDGCDIRDALVILKDLRLVGLSQFSKADFPSHNLKTCLLWCIEHFQNLSILQLINITLIHVSNCYRIHHLPDFFDTKCNLIEHMKSEITREISRKVDEVRRKLDFYFAECLVRKNLFHQCLKEKIFAHGFFKAQLLKIYCKLLLKSSFLFVHMNSYLFWKLNKTACAKWGNENSEDIREMLYRENDPEILPIRAAMLKSVLNNIIKILK